MTASPHYVILSIMLFINLLSYVVGSSSPDLFANSISLHENIVYITGQWSPDDKLSHKDNFILFQYSTLHEYVPSHAQIKIYQKSYVLYENDNLHIQNITQKYSPISWAKYNYKNNTDILSKVDYTIPINFIITVQSDRTPHEFNMIPDNQITFKVNIKTGTRESFSETATALVTPSPYSPSSSSSPVVIRPELHFRSWCNGQANDSTTILDIPECFETNRFHLLINNLNLTRATGDVYNNSALTFHIQGGAVLKMKNGIVNPQYLQCRLNTHYVTFNRVPNPTSQFPKKQAIYITHDLDELQHNGAFELECEKAGIFFDIFERDTIDPTNNATKVLNPNYNAFITVTVGYDEDFQSKSPDLYYITRPSVTIPISPPNQIAPFDLDIHATTAYETEDSIQHRLDLFGGFYLTAPPSLNDELIVCAKNIKITTFDIFITQRGLNSNKTEIIHYPLYQKANVSATIIDPITQCLHIQPFSQHPHRIKSFELPQVFNFILSTNASAYTPASSIWGSFKSTVGTEVRTIYSTTPLPIFPALAKTLTTGFPTYTAEDAEQYNGEYNAKFNSELTVSDISYDLATFGFILSGNHVMDGDISCNFKYINVNGEDVEDDISATVDKTVQSAKMILFDFADYGVLDHNRTQKLSIVCRGLFVYSLSRENFLGTSILQLFGKINTDKKEEGKYAFITLPNFHILDAEKSPAQFPIPDTNDDNNGGHKWSTLRYVAIALLIFVIIAVIVYLVIFKLKLKKSPLMKEPLIGTDDGELFINEEYTTIG